MTRITLDDNGFEALLLFANSFGRQPREQFRKTKRQTMTSTQMLIVPQKFGEARFIEQLIQWEVDITEYEGVTKERLPHLLKELLVTKTTGGMYRYF